VEDLKEAYIHGVFLNEIKNRFLCNVSINGEETICYIPSSCRLSNFIDLTGREVLLKPITSPNARTKYSVYALKFKRGYILLNLAQANQIVEAQIHKRLFSFLGKRENVIREFKIGGYKTDLFIEDSKTLIEIKSSLAFEKEAVFPSVYSERSIKQLTEIASLLDAGYNACYIFASLNPYIKTIRINQDIPEFCNALNYCISKGMTVHAYAIKLVEAKPLIQSEIEVVLT